MKSLTALALVTLLAACGDSAADSDETPSMDAGTTGSKCDYKEEKVTLTKDLTIPKGKTVRVCEGVTFTASTDVKIDVLGELLVEGTEKSPVNFVGTEEKPRSWHGIVVEKTGSIMLTHAKIGGAIYGLFTEPGSSFVIERSLFDTSFKTAVLQSEGMVADSTFLASPPPTFAITDAVTIDDPNGSMTIIDASPSISNCKFVGASAFTDLVRVGGEASPTFDHVSLSSAHCAFHTSGGTNTTMKVSNSIIEKMAYGIMAFATKPEITDSVFRKNGNDVGLCSGATEDNTPILMNNSYEGGDPTVDASCFKIGTKDAKPAMTENAKAGPSGL